MSKGGLRFVALGGVGEFGANVALYGHDGKWLMVDCGIAFADGTVPGVDLLAPDLSFIVEQRENLVGLVLTHAHEDHLGAVAHVWRELQCPVYATPFTAAILRTKLQETGLADRVPVHVVALGGSAEIGAFRVSYVPVAHSILEAHSVAIRTPDGLFVHSGDWKLDDAPCIGPLTDEAVLRKLGDEGVTALFGDSTNAMTDGHSGSEGALRKSLREIVAGCTGRVAVTQFASNAARIESVVRAAADNDREVVVAGRSLWRTIGAAQECGYLRDLPPLLEEDEAPHLPPRNTLLLLTGCQGEARGAMSRVAFGEHRNVRLRRGDTVIFSSKAIPGNEREIGRVASQLTRSGVRVVTGRDSFVHVSGHPARDELAKMIQWLRPRIVVPVHGELTHLEAHAELARAQGEVETIVVENGAMLEIGPDGPKVVGEVAFGKRAITAAGLRALDSPGVTDRRRMMFNGAVAVFLVLDPAGNPVSPPSVVLRGLDVENGVEAAATAVAERIADLPRARRR
ncbi:MAG: ribonuclease J, partial [Proteobacteria bacterium]|nr:ribonuclease J [Pseudomonadota bacterium]